MNGVERSMRTERDANRDAGGRVKENGDSGVSAKRLSVLIMNRRNICGGLIQGRHHVENDELYKRWGRQTREKTWFMTLMRSCYSVTPSS